MSRAHLVSGVALLRPDEQVFEAMLEGWRNRQLARNLKASTIEKHENTVRAFVTATNTYPWHWAPQIVDYRHCGAAGHSGSGSRAHATIPL